MLLRVKLLERWSKRLKYYISTSHHLFGVGLVRSLVFRFSSRNILPTSIHLPNGSFPDPMIWGVGADKTGLGMFLMGKGPRKKVDTQTFSQTRSHQVQFCLPELGLPPKCMCPDFYVIINMALICLYPPLEA